jgi:DNA processing protein
VDKSLSLALLACLVYAEGRRRGWQMLSQRDPQANQSSALKRYRRQADALLKLCRQSDVQMVTPEAAQFPEPLRHIPDPPALLFFRGNLDQLQRPAIAVVGARRCTHLGREVAAALAADISAKGWVVASGLARGVDGAAHRAALPRGLTAAVLGGGLARPFPAAHRILANEIVARGGLLLSEYPPFASPRPYQFPERNRLISGLSRAVVVVEAGERSGSLITARMALEQGRDVMAVPGPVSSPVSRGCHRLIKQGAALIETASDVFEALGVEAFDTSEAAGGRDGAIPGAPSGPGLAKLLGAVGSALTTLDQIIAAVGMPAQRVIPQLVELELGGFVQQVPGGYIRRPLRESPLPHQGG